MDRFQVVMCRCRSHWTQKACPKHGFYSRLLATVQNKNSEFCAPLTSFDWNETDPKRLGTSSIDTTCTIWDIEVRSLSLAYRHAASSRIF